MIKISSKKSNFVELVPVFKKTKVPSEVSKEKNAWTFFPSKNTAYLYLGSESELTLSDLEKAFEICIAKNEKGLNIDIKEFVTENITEAQIIKLLVETYEYKTQILWNKKTGSKKPKEAKDIVILDNKSDSNKSDFSESMILSEARSFARNLQTMSPNECNSVSLADLIKKEFSSSKNIDMKILTLTEIKKLNMGLLLSVNAASAHEARVVVLEYSGNPSSNEKTVMIGKGITFDSGGMNLKPGGHILGMKYDMSGAAVVVSAMKAISSLKPKANISIVAPLTDNVISNTASLPDSVWTSMNGKTVEINNTDAEGRLVMADAITYGIKKLNATKIIDIATLTGAVLVALGNTYTGAWATNDEDWKLIEETAISQNELVWRMPFHKDFAKNINKSTVADLKNADPTGKGGSSSAAMFLKEFTEDIPYIHLDIAGSSEDGTGISTGPLVKTLAKLF